MLNKSITLLKKCPYSELFWSAFPSIRTGNGDIRSISTYSVRMRENTDQNNSEYGHFSRSLICHRKYQKPVADGKKTRKRSINRYIRNHNFFKKLSVFLELKYYRLKLLGQFTLQLNMI